MATLSMPSFKGMRFWILCVCVALASTLLAARYLNRQSALERGPSEAKAWLSQHPMPVYVAEYEERLATPNKHAVSRRETVGVRQDGSRAVLDRCYNVNKGVLSHTERTLYLSSGIVVSVWQDLRLVSARRDKTALHPSTDRPRRLDPDTDCQSDYYGDPQYTRAGDDEQLLGFRAVPLKPIAGAGSLRTQSWRLPEIGCIEGRRLATFVDKNGTITDTSEMVLTSVSLTAPEDQMFDVPQDYEAARPSEAISRLAQFVHGPPVSVREMALLKRADDNYDKNKVDVSTLK